MALLSDLRFRALYAQKMSAMGEEACLPEKTCHVVELRNLAEGDRRLFQSLSLQVQHIQSALVQTFERQRELIKAAGFDAYSGCLEGHFNPVESTLLECGCAISCCPICGKACVSRESYPVRDFIHILTFYRFTCHGEFYLLKGSPSTVGLYLPEHELIIRYVDEDISLGQMFYQPVQLVEVLALFKQLLSASLEEAFAYQRSGNTRQMHYLTANFKPIGHHLINELPGIQRLVDNGLADRLAIVAEPLFHYFELAELFPEIGRTEDWSCGSEEFHQHAGQLFRRALAANAFVVACYHNGQIQDALDRRILDYASARVRPEVRRKIEETACCWPRLWVTLRTGNRSWPTQNRGIVELLTAIQRSYPGMVVIFDGVPKEAPDLAAITAELPPDLKWVDALHLELMESIYWCHFIDAHVSPVGNSGVFMSMANIPGVYHGGSRILKHYCTGNNGAETFSLHPREGAAENLAAVASKDYTPEKDMHFCDYEVEVSDLIIKLERILGRLSRQEQKTNL
jgi:hypothetical protein